MVKKKSSPSSRLSPSSCSFSSSTPVSPALNDSACPSYRAGIHISDTSASSPTSPVTPKSVDRSNKAIATDCQRFQPQVWRPTKCLVCFHDRDLHTVEAIRASLLHDPFHEVVDTGLVKERVDTFSTPGLDLGLESRPAFHQQNSIVRSLVEAAESRRGSEDAGNSRRGSEDFNRANVGLDLFLEDVRVAKAKNRRSSEKGGRTPTSRSPRRLLRTFSSSALDRPFGSSTTIHVPHSCEVTGCSSCLSSSSHAIVWDPINTVVSEPIFTSEMHGSFSSDSLISTVLQAGLSPSSSSLSFASELPCSLSSSSPDLVSFPSVDSSLPPPLPELPQLDILSQTIERVSLLIDAPPLPLSSPPIIGLYEPEDGSKSDRPSFQESAAIVENPVSNRGDDAVGIVLTILYRGDLSGVLTAATCKAPLPAEILQGQGVLFPPEAPSRVQLLLRAVNDPQAVRNLLLARFSLPDHVCLYMSCFDGSPVSLDASLESGAYLIFSYLPFPDLPLGIPSSVTPPRPPARRPELMPSLAQGMQPQSRVSPAHGIRNFQSPLVRPVAIDFPTEQLRPSAIIPSAPVEVSFEVIPPLPVRSSLRFPEALGSAGIACPRFPCYAPYAPFSPVTPSSPRSAPTVQRGAYDSSVATAFSYVSPSALTTVQLTKMHHPQTQLISQQVVAPHTWSFRPFSSTFAPSSRPPPYSSF